MDRIHLHDRPFAHQLISREWKGDPGRKPPFRYATELRAYMLRTRIELPGALPFDFIRMGGDLVGSLFHAPAPDPWRGNAGLAWLDADQKAVASGDPAELAAVGAVADLPPGKPSEWFAFTERFIAEQMAGHVVEAAIHDPARKGEGGPPHVHMLIAAKAAGPDGFLRWSSGSAKSSVIAAWRDEWCRWMGL